MPLPHSLLPRLRPALATPAALTLSAALIALAVVMGSGQPAQATPTEQATAARQPHQHKAARLTVTGQGFASAQPDLARITVGVSVQAETAAEAMRQNAERQNAVIDQLKASGLEDRDIQTSGLSLSPMQDYSQEGRPPVVTGYSAQNMVSLRVRDLTRLGEVLDRLVESGANEINSISFELEDSSEVEDSARANAVASAQQRAAVMARASGQVLGPLLSLSDSRVNTPPQPFMAAQMARDSAALTPIQAGELSFDASVTAVYLLLPADHEADKGADKGNDAMQAPTDGDQ